MHTTHREAVGVLDPLPKPVYKLINIISNSSPQQHLTDGKLVYTQGYGYHSGDNDMNPWIMIDLQRTLSVSQVNITLRAETFVIENFGNVRVSNVYCYQSYYA